MSATATEAAVALQKIKGFMPHSQYRVIVEAMGGEESQFFRDKVVEMAGIIDAMPKTYETDGQGLEAVVHLHYFGGAVDAWVTEKDMGDPSAGDTSQTQAFGKVCLGDPQNAELGYINIEELCENGIELDLYWTPVKLKDLK